MYWVPTWPSGSNSAALIVWIDSLFGRVASYDGQRLSLHRLPGQKNGAELAVQVGQLWHAHRADRRWHILVNVGPGTFTGLKVGLGSVHAMHDWLGAQGVELQIAGLRSTVALWLALGGVMAAPMFASSAVAMPLLLDRRVTLLQAVLISWQTVLANPVPMGLWAAIIMASTLLGLGSLMLGLVLVIPILGHASWHAYRALVDTSGLPARETLDARH